MPQTGIAAFYLYPDPGPGSPWTLSFGECVTSYTEAPDVEVADAVTLSGRRQRAIGRWGKRVRLTLERMASREELAWQMLALQNHLDRGYSVAFTADTGKAWASFFGATALPAAGDTLITPGANAWSSLVGSNSLAAGDWIRIYSEASYALEQAGKIQTWTASNNITLAATTPIRFDFSGKCIASWSYFWPLLKRPEDNVGTNIVVNEVGRLWTMSIDLVIDLAALFALWPFQGDGALGGSGQRGNTLDKIAGTNATVEFGDAAVAYDGDFGSIGGAAPDVLQG